MRRALSTLLLAATSVALAACGSIAGPDAQPEDVYLLKTVQGVAAPYALTFDPSITISGREVTMSVDGTFTDVVELTVADDDWSTVLPSSRKGTYTAAGTALRLVYRDGQVAEAERDGRTLTLNDDGLIFVLTR